MAVCVRRCACNQRHCKQFNDKKKRTQYHKDDVTCTGWQWPYPGYFGFIFVQWEVEMLCPSLYTVIVQLYEVCTVYKSLQYQWLSSDSQLTKICIYFVLYAVGQKCPISTLKVFSQHTDCLAF